MFELVVWSCRGCADGVFAFQAEPRAAAIQDEKLRVVPWAALEPALDTEELWLGRSPAAPEPRKTLFVEPRSSATIPLKSGLASGSCAQHLVIRAAMSGAVDGGISGLACFTRTLEMICGGFRPLHGTSRLQISKRTMAYEKTSDFSENVQAFNYEPSPAVVAGLSADV